MRKQWNNKKLWLIFVFALFIISIVDVNCETSEYTDENDRTIYFDSKTEIVEADYSDLGEIINATIRDALWINETTQKQYRVNVKIENKNIKQIVKNSNIETKSFDLVLDNLDSWLKENLWTILPIFIISFAVLYRAFYRSMTRPFTRVTNYKDLQKEEIGKYIESYPIEDSNGYLYCHKFKGAKGIKKVYSDSNWGVYDINKWMEIAKITHYYPFLFLFKDYEVPLGMNLTDTKIKKYWLNYFIYPFYAISTVLGFSSLTNRLYSLFKKEKIQLEKIDFIISFVKMEMIEDRYDCEYRKYQINTKTGKREYINHSKKNLTYSELEDLKEMEDKNVEGTNFSLVEDLEYSKHTESKKFNNLKEAVANYRTRLQERAETKFEILKYQKIAEDNYSLYKQTLEQLETRKMTEQQRMNEMIKPILNETEKRTISLPIALANFVKYRSNGADIDESMKMAVKDAMKEVYMESNERMNYIKENEKLKAKIENLQSIFKDRLKSIDDNQITIRSEQPNPGEVD